MKNKQDSLYKAIGGVNEKFILEAETVTPVKQKKRLKAVFKVALAAAILSIAGAIAIAASPALQNLLNLPFVRENPKLTRVPDGYVGIYTAEDLDTIRENPDGDYILMADIDLGSALHTPIGTIEAPFSGNFNGNGYRVTNFRIEEGIFGDADEIRIRMHYAGFFGYAPYAVIRNLGIENAHISLKNIERGSIGMIAGYAGYVAASYVKDCTVTVDCTAVDGTNSIFIGGICGNVYTLDSCYSVCDISIGGIVNENSSSLYAGKLAGMLYTAVTSWTDSTLEVNCPGFSAGLAGQTRCCPKVVPQSVFESIVEQIKLRGDTAQVEDPEYTEQNPLRSPFYLSMFLAFYQLMDKEEMQDALGGDGITELFYYEDFDASAEEYYFVYEASASMREMLRTDSILRASFTKEELVEIFSSSYLKIGELCCYDLADGTPTYEGFDFTSVWQQTDSTPTLKIFGK